MATVYHAVQEGPLGFENEVAVKVVHPELLEEHPFLLQNLVDEARIAARVRHPNIVRILDLVEDRERFYLVMDYVDGVSMRQVLDAARASHSRPPVAPVLEVLALAARGLDAAHHLVLPDGTSMGLVHRDMKPGNILVSHDGLVKVSDFGVALFGDRITEETMTGQMKGTPAYMSPEQALGDPVSGRSDIFSLGLTLYTLLTTKLVHQAESAVRLAMKIVTEPLDDQAAELEALVPGLGPVFLTACARNPADRYGDANQLAAALDTVRATLKSPTSVAEMIAATGWKPRQFSLAHIEREPTDPQLALANTADLAVSLADAVGPAGTGFEESLVLDADQPLPLDNSWDGSSLGRPDGDDDEEPTVAGARAPSHGAELLGPLAEGDESLDDEPTDAGALAPTEPLEDAAPAPPTGQTTAALDAVDDGRLGRVLDPGAPGAELEEDPESTPIAAHAPPRLDPATESDVLVPDPSMPNVDIVLPPRVPPPPGGPTGPLHGRAGMNAYPGAGPGPIPGRPLPGGPLPGGPLPGPMPAPLHGGPIPGGPLPGPMPGRPGGSSLEATRPAGPGKPLQPTRDYRGRVVRNNPLQQNTSISRGEKLGVAVAFVLLLIAVATIVGLQVLRPTPDNLDPRLVDGSLPSAPARVALPPQDTPAPTPPPADGSLKPPPTDAPAADAAGQPVVGDVIVPGGTVAAAKPGELLPGAVVEHKARSLDDRAREATAKKKAAARKAQADEDDATEPEPAKPGTLVVNSYPWSRVFVDGAEVGTTPLRGHSLPAGSHQVKLVFPSADGVEHSQSVTIKPGEQATVIKKLDPT